MLCGDKNIINRTYIIIRFYIVLFYLLNYSLINKITNFTLMVFVNLVNMLDEDILINEEEVIIETVELLQSSEDFDYE